MEYDELMQSISVLEFGQQLPQAAGWIGEIDRHILYSWMAICVFYEYQTYHKHKGTESVRQFVDSRFSSEQTAEQVEELVCSLMERLRKHRMDLAQCSLFLLELTTAH